MHKFIPLILIAAAACSSARSVPAQGVELEGPDAPVRVSSKIDRTVRVSEYSQERLEDGRLQLHTVLMSDKDEDLAIIAVTEWLDERGAVVGTSDGRSMVLPPATPVTYQEASWDTAAVRARVNIRPASTKRRRR